MENTLIEPVSEVRHEKSDIEQLAHALWLERGAPVGTPEVDWTRAEELLGIR